MKNIPFLWKDRRKKPWRKIRTGTDRVLRLICCSVLLAEGAWIVQTYGEAAIHKYFVMESREIPVSGGEESSETVQPGTLQNIYGITIEWRDGTIRIYRRKEYWKEETSDINQKRK